MHSLRSSLVAPLLFLAACSESHGGKGEVGSSANAARAVFIDVSEATGIKFTHERGLSGQRYMPETMGSGVAVLDYDGDGLMDLYFVDSGEIPTGNQPPKKGGNRLYRNLGSMHFEDVTEKAKVPGRGYGMGAIAGDLDRDGDQDLYVTAFGSNTLYINQGDGTFRDETDLRHADDDRWSMGAAFLDFDNDGHLDLFIQNYVDFSVDKHRACFASEKLVYCTPDQYEPLPCKLLRNRGDGTFENVSVAAGIAGAKGKGLGVCVEDFDDDGLVEIYCANDTIANQLFRNLGGGLFEEIGMVSGTAYSEDGKEEAGMGVDAADLNQDGRPDLVVTNFQGETNALYRNEGNLFFTEVSRVAGTAATALARLGFGIRCFDYDADGLSDFVIANGHVYDNGSELTPPVPYAQPPTLWHGLGKGRFEDVTDEAGPGFATPMVGRGLALADLDLDGDEDLIVTTSGGRPKIFENVYPRESAWVSVRLEGKNRDRTALGAKISVRTGALVQSRTVRSGGSYLSHSDLAQVFGLGSAAKIDEISVRWPGGQVETVHAPPLRRLLLIRESEGLKTASAPRPR